MKNLLDQLTQQSLLRTILMGILGLLLLFIPGPMLDIIVYIIAALVILGGLLSLYKQVSANGWSFGNLETWIGPILIVVGILMIIFSRPLISILPIFLGILLVVGGAYYLYQGVRAGNKNWMQILLAVLLIIGGLIIIFNPFGTLTTLLRIFGILLLVACVYEIFTFFTSRK